MVNPRVNPIMLLKGLSAIKPLKPFVTSNVIQKISNISAAAQLLAIFFFA